MAPSTVPTTEQHPEQAPEQTPTSRKGFFKVLGGGGAAATAAFVLAACGQDDSESTGGGTADKPEPSMGGGGGDIAIANYALTLEYIEADFYDAVIASGEVKDKKIAEMAKAIGQNEQEHVDGLIALIKKSGGKPAARPKTTFDSVLAGGPMKILTTAADVENLGAAAYLGQAGRIKSKEVLAAALAIHSIEARHAAALNTLVGKSIVPDGAFAKPASMSEVLPKVKPFLVS